MDNFHHIFLCISITWAGTLCFFVCRPALETETIVFIPTISTLAGAWLGAFPIPLDWDRPWQVTIGYWILIHEAVVFHYIIYIYKIFNINECGYQEEELPDMVQV
jgi:hypothetical protein